MRRILLAVGETATTLQTARQIRPWLRERDTSLTLLAVATSSPPSPLSHTKRTLEQIEAIFTGPNEQPGIILRVGNDPAAEICRETRHGQYDLLALGLRDSAPAQSRIGSTCQRVIENCTIPMFVTPPTLHLGITPQILILVADHPLSSPVADWMIAQCQAQRLSAILYASSPEQSDPLAKEMAKVKIRAQTIAHPQFSADSIHALSQDRRVRWIVVPAGLGYRDASPAPLIQELLSKTSCPVLLEPGMAS